MPGITMRIASLRAVQPRTPADPPETDWRTALGQILVIVETDAGVRGLGVGGWSRYRRSQGAIMVPDRPGFGVDMDVGWAGALGDQPLALLFFVEPLQDK